MSGIVVVSGAIANKHRSGGAIWTRLSWLLGFRALGFQVFFLEQIALSACEDNSGKPASFTDSANLSAFRRVADEFRFTGTLMLDDGSEAYGLSVDEMKAVAADAELLVNISGHLRYPPLFGAFRRKAYVDLDPGFTQFWHVSQNGDAPMEGHDVYYTIGENTGRADCSIPRNGIDWRAIRQPVVLELWPACRDFPAPRFTTIASWRGPYGPIEIDGRTLGLKVHQFRRFLALPRCVDATFEIALDIHASDGRDRDALLNNGWALVDPAAAAGDTNSFRRYVQDSAAEFSVAQGIYVDTWSGWFSDRTVRYLASGRPAVVQDTGFSMNYPVGSGLIPFRSVDEAVAGARGVLANYDCHARAARALAEEYFDAKKVLGRLADELGLRL
jgi:hypothetical protein